VMLTIILAVTTYLFYRQYDEWFTTAKNETAKASKSAADARKNGDDANELKRMLGVAPTEGVDAIKDTLFKDDMKKYGYAYPEESRFYRPLLEKMSKTINQRNAELADEKAKIPKLEDDFKKREAARDLQVKQFQDASTKATQVPLPGCRRPFRRREAIRAEARHSIGRAVVPAGVLERIVVRIFFRTPTCAFGVCRVQRRPDRQGIWALTWLCMDCPRAVRLRVCSSRSIPPKAAQLRDTSAFIAIALG